MLLQRSTGRLILNVLCGHLPTNLPGHVLVPHSCLGKLEKNSCQLHVWTVVSFPEPDPMEKQGLRITNFFNNCLKMQTCPGVMYVQLRSLSAGTWSLVWKSGFSAAETLASFKYHHPSLWTAVFYVFETRAFIYVPSYRIRCNRFSIFVLIATCFRGTKLR